jgi:hypothetical protein
MQTKPQSTLHHFPDFFQAIKREKTRSFYFILNLGLFRFSLCLMKPWQTP